MDPGQRGARDVGAASGFGVLPAPHGLLPRGDCDVTSFPHSGRGVRRPQESQVCDEAAVGDVSVERVSEEERERERNVLVAVRDSTTRFETVFVFCF